MNLPKNAVFFAGDGKSVKRGFEGRKSCSKQENCWSRNFFSRLSLPSFLKETFFANFVFFRVFVILQGISFLQKCEKMTKKWRKKMSAGFCIFQKKPLFSEFFWKAKLVIFGKNDVFRPFQHFFTKNSSFFRKKSWFFSIFFAFFFEKKICKKTQKNVIFQKVRRLISGEMTKSAKKNMRKKWIFAFLNPLQKCEFTKKRSFFRRRRKKCKTRFWREKELFKTRKLLVAKLFFSPLAP